MAARKTRSARRPGARGWVTRGTAGQQPAAPLAVLAVLIVTLYATMFATGNLTPRLAIDLAGGTSATYNASPAPGSKTITSAEMSTAVNIMQERVNAFGVSEAQVSQEGSNTIQVEIPGHNSQELVNQIGATALLYFRPVLTEAAVTTPAPSTSPTGSASPSASSTAKTSTSATPTTSAATTAASAKASGQAESMTVHKAAAFDAASVSTPKASGAATHAAGAAAAAPASPSPSSSANSAAAASATDAQAKYASLNCTDKGALKAAGQVLPADYLATCSKDGKVKYLLGPSLVAGIDVSSAQAVPVTAGTTVTNAWQILLNFDKKGADEFKAATTTLYAQTTGGTGSGAFAIVLDGIVESAPVVQGVISGGQAQITGQFSQTDADNLATQLNYGALPLRFDVSQTSIVSPTLGGNELSGGLIAGAIGLFLVFLYVIFYYRGLSAVAIASLLIAGSVTYASAVLLGPLMGFTLSLAGVAGLIVAIGITADSFVVFFERLRDEVREGRTLRTAVEHGWVRARRTIVASDFVSFLAAAVLYLWSIGSVKGFAFTLGLTTVIDIVVVFLFTKPLVTLLARSEFFGGGHAWSGLAAERLGGQKAQRVPTGPRTTIAERRRAEQAAAAEANDGADSDDTKRVEA